MMNLDEAIQHCEEVAKEKESHGYCDRSLCVIMDVNNATCDECEAVKCRECASEHRQLAEWLKELKAYRKQDSVAISNLSMSHILNHEVKWINERMTREDNPNICDDVVSREAVMDIVKRWYPYKAEIEQLKALPSVTPQQRIGWWILTHRNGVNMYICSECNNEPLLIGESYPIFKLSDYCPYCGAKMEVEE